MKLAIFMALLVLALAITGCQRTITEEIKDNVNTLDKAVTDDLSDLDSLQNELDNSDIEQFEQDLNNFDW